jgi:competence protein ComEC
LEHRSKDSVNSVELQYFCGDEAVPMSELETPSTQPADPTAWPHRPLVSVVLSFGIAIILAEQSADQLVWGFILSGVFAGVCVGVALRWRAARSLLLAAACTLVLGYAYTLWSAVYLPADHVSRHLVPTPITLEGQILRAMKTGQGKTTLDLSARALIADTAVTPVSGRVRLTAADFEPPVEAGDTVRVHRIRLRRPSGFRNPGAFDFGRYLARRGIYATGTVGKADRVEVVHRLPNSFPGRFSRFKADLMAHINRVMPEPEAGITQEMVFGVPGAVPPEAREAFVASGTAHLMSVSGLHVGFVYAAVFFVLRPVLINVRFRLFARFSGGPRPSKLTALCGLVAVVGYACLVGPNFPTIRSTLMIATYVLAYLFDRDGDPFHTTALAALLILALYPLALFDIGFQLSFAGVLAILYANRLLHPPGDAGDAGTRGLSARLKGKLWDAMLISVFASLGTAPLALYYFQRVPLIAPLANIVVVPVASPIVPLGLLAPFAALLSQALGDVLFQLTALAITFMYALVRFFAAIPYAAPRLGSVSLPAIVFAYGTLLLVPYHRAYRLARWGVGGGTLLVGVWLTWPWLFPEGHGQLRVTFLDVGQGEASFIRFPHGATMLIDGGGSYRDDFDIGQRVVAPFLWHKRLRTVDYVVATHPHPDHAKGLRFILQDFRVQQFWDNGAPLQSGWYRGLRETAIERGIYRDVVAEGFQSTTIDGVRLDLLHPSTAFQPQAERRARTQEDRDENNRSLVLKLTYGAISFLFAGDIEQEAEAFLLHTGRDIRATVLKAPHHGSRTSSSDAFLRAVGPSAVVFSVQRDNRFGHPAPAVVARYEAFGAQIFRTDHHGALTFWTDGHSLWVERYGDQPVTVSAAAPSSPAASVMPAPAAAPPSRSAPPPAASGQPTGWGNRPESPAPPPPDSAACSAGSEPACR